MILHQPAAVRRLLAHSIQLQIAVNEGAARWERASKLRLGEDERYACFRALVPRMRELRKLRGLLGECGTVAPDLLSEVAELAEAAMERAALLPTGAAGSAKGRS